jgi:signal transduction histidine kinase
MELHRLSSGVERPEPREFDLVAFARRVLRDYRDAAIVTDAAEVTFCTDSRRLATVLFAVLDNAALHGRAPIRVAVAPGEIVVSDSGGGFSPRLLTEATRPFTTGSRVSGQGVGLGLAIASVQMSILGGTLTVENDSGARVTLTLRGQRPLPD